MPETTFGIAYDGPALASGRMPVRDLAPALIALGDLFSLSSGILYPQLDPVTVKVEATKEGSFYVHLLIEGGEAAWEQMVDLFSSREINALTTLRDVVLLSGGLFWLIKRVGARKVESTERAPDPGRVILKLDDHTTLEIPTDVWALYRNVDVRKHTREVVEPLAREGIDILTFTAEREEQVEIHKEDLPAYAVIDAKREELLDQLQEMYVEIVSVAFIRGNKWRLGLGEYTFWALVDDDDFLDRVESGQEAFRKGDVLRCRMEITQTRDAEGLHTEYAVIEVLEHLPRPTQLVLGDGEP